MTWHPNNKTVIVNQSTWDRLNPRERNKVGLIQLNVGAIVANNKAECTQASRLTEELIALQSLQGTSEK